MTYSSEVLADSPLAYWRQGEASGTTIVDSSGNSRSGTYSGGFTVGATGLLAGDSDTAVTYNGTTGRGDIAHGAWADVAAFTAECWFATTQNSTIRVLYSRYHATNGRVFQITMTSGQLNLTVFNGTTGTSVATTAGTYFDGLPHHAVATFSGGTATFYVDGVLIGSLGGLTVTTSSNSPFFLANRDGAFFFTGTLDEVAYYGTALSSGRVAAHYAAGTGGAATVSLPVLAGTFAAPAPTVAVGSALPLPVLSFTVTAPAPTVVGGAPVSATVALPALTFTYTTLASTQVSAVNVGLPLLTFTMSAPAGWFSGAAGGASNKPLPFTQTATLMDTDGLTPIAVLPNAVIGPWTEENSAPGHGTFRVPLDDATTASITMYRIVQFGLFYEGVRIGTFSVRIVSEAVQIAVDGRRWLRFEDQPGLLSMLGDAVVYPEYGLNRHSQPTRVFGWMAAPGNWLRNGDWHAPQGDALSSETTYRKKHPPELVQTDPDWLAANNPATAQPPTAKNYLRNDPPLTITDGTFARVTATADNYITLYHNGEQIMSPDYSNPLGWRNATSQNIYLAPGDHIFPGQCENGPWPENNGYSPIGFIFALHQLDHSGKVTGVLLKSDTTNWIAHDDTPDPGWYRAQIVRTLVIEAQARNVLGCLPIRLGFTDFHDTNGLAWDTPENLALNVGTQTVLDAVQQLTESKMDVVLRPSDMTLYAWKKRGQDLSATVLYKPGDQGGTLKSFNSTVKAPTATVVLSQVADSQWVETVDPAASTTGRIEVGSAVGSATSVSTARTVAQGQLAETAVARVSVDAETSVLERPIPYLDFHVGDVISTPGVRNIGTAKHRVLAITVDGSGDVFRMWPELVQDTTV